MEILKIIKIRHNRFLKKCMVKKLISFCCQKCLTVVFQKSFISTCACLKICPHSLVKVTYVLNRSVLPLIFFYESIFEKLPNYYGVKRLDFVLFMLRLLCTVDYRISAELSASMISWKNIPSNIFGMQPFPRKKNAAKFQRWKIRTSKLYFHQVIVRGS